MKAIMYHYIRPEPKGLPFFRYLHLDDFRSQLDLFEREHGFLSREDFLQALDSGDPAGPGVVLTFDDAFADHFDYVLPELRRRGLWGIFYIPTGMYQNGALLDVHRLHLLLGAFGGDAILAGLNNMISPEMLSQSHIEEFRSLAYDRQDNEANAAEVKLMLNYFISYEYGEEILDRLMHKFFNGTRLESESFYVSSKQINILQESGMIVGSHAVSHRMFSKLPVAEQKREIESSFDFLDRVTGGLEFRTFCFPYGGNDSFNAESERLLEEAGCAFSFKVEPRNITADDLSQRRQALPRFDCNRFQYGQVR
jgi:peptidoglycan/xylan/chitin deacetylase (PgdA/CDA1 family)